MTHETPTAGERTRARILETALPRFAADGFAGTSVRTLADAAGVNVATLAWHFGDKEGLYRACVERLYADLATIDSTALEGDDPLEALVRRAWAFVRDHRDHVRLLHRHLLDAGRHHDVLAERWLDPLFDRARPALTALRPDATETERRLMLFTAAHVLVRFVLDEPEFLARAVGADAEDEIVAWLVRVVRALILA